jgi:RES domain-containing protein
MLYEVDATLHNVLDLTDDNLLQSLKIDQVALGAHPPDACQQVGGAAEWLGHDGILVPSARHSGVNLVIYPNQRSVDALFEVVSERELSPGS